VTSTELSDFSGAAYAPSKLNKADAADAGDGCVLEYRVNVGLPPG